MRVYVDESGDPGFKTDKGSSKTFSIVLVIFQTNQDLETTVNEIRKLESRLNIPQSYEWHFSKLNKDRRAEFLSTISKCPLEIRAVSMIKENIYGVKLKTDSSSFYNYSCKLLLQYANRSLQEAKIIFDRRGPRDFNTHLRQYLRKKCDIDHTIIKEIQSKDSRKDKPLQIADMVAGAIGRSLSEKSDRLDYISIIQHKIINHFRFPDDLKRQ